ncbi:MAG: restriction endonuclease subunit S [Acinetobacter sp.]|uniref:restriction endonuclease subunit S n=1 Tax=Acinetobacter sp. TaxID=472 RepID=UPI002585D161|nr:restriction endonuclease subunit S [Acinetobacter sp.]MCE1270308.1 restriction endonuclease subunit S [Acinetobacter sp.]
MAKYQKYAEYQDSGVEWLGEIPKHWQSVPSRGVVEHIVEKNSDNVLSNYLSLMANIGVIRYEDKGDIGNKKPEDLSKCKIVRKGQLVINSMNYSIGSYGMSPYDGICSPVYIVLQSLSGIYLERFALRIFENSFFQKYLSTFGNGILEHRAAINWDDIKGKYVPLPPLIEQENILNFLDYETAKIDGLIAKQEKLIELLKEKRQAVISHAITKGLNPNVPMKDSGVEWLGEVPEHWSVTKLAYRYEVLLGKMLDESRITGNYLGKYLRNTDVQWGRINTENLPEMDFRPYEVERYSVKQGDLLVCEGGEIGRCAIWESEEACFYQKALHRLRAYSNQDNHKFMFYVLFDSVHRERFISGAAKATIAHLPAETFKQYRFAFPPKIEQAQIVEYLDTMSKTFDEIEKKALAQIELLKERRTALISAAVTGKIDVRDWQHTNQNNEVDVELRA